MIEKGTYRFCLYWFPIILYCLIIFLQSSFPSPLNVDHTSSLNQVLHFGGYALLGILFLRAFVHSRFKHNDIVIIMISILLTGIYAATDELHQYYTPYRKGDIWDFFFDLLGGIAGVYIYYLFLKKIKKGK